MNTKKQLITAIQIDLCNSIRLWSVSASAHRLPLSISRQSGVTCCSIPSSNSFTLIAAIIEFESVIRYQHEFQDFLQSILMKKKDTIYGINENPWPYDWVIDSLLFFSMNETARDNYINSIDSDSRKDYTNTEIRDAIIQGFAQYIRLGLRIDEWINDEELEKLKLEKYFQEIEVLGMSSDDTAAIRQEWTSIAKITSLILKELGWSDVTDPFTSPDEMWAEYRHHDAGGGWGWGAV